MSEFELNEDRNEFEVLQGFVYNDGNNNNNSTVRLRTNLVRTKMENRWNKFKENIYAFQSLCPHAGAKMVMGYIDMQGNAVCPLHRFKFSLKNGYNVTGEGYNMKTYPIELREDGIFVGF
jgi:nitrite reductase/ring-hydroxylating ferredoxin subunit